MMYVILCCTRFIGVLLAHDSILNSTCFLDLSGKVIANGPGLPPGP